ncbi:Rubredoxin [subsurface metagenome]
MLNISKYECTACGYIFDEDAEGKKWEDLPDDYTCPVCGVGKDMFEKID